MKPMKSTPLDSLKSSLEAFRNELSTSARIAILVSDQVLRERLTAALEARGRSVRAFTDAAAFRIWWQESPRLAVGLIELDHPAFDGLEIMREIRAQDDLAELVALASEPDAALAVRCLDVGAHDLFPLPIDRTDLLLSRVSAGMERWRRATVDQRITEQFSAFAKQLFRREDKGHREALRDFSAKLFAYKRELAESSVIIYIAANAYAGERVRAFLETEGFQVHLYTSVNDAVAAADSLEPRLLLSEVEVTDGTAFDAYEAISVGSPDIEFLVISPANAADLALEAMEHGARDCVLKPHEGLEAIRQKSERALKMQANHFKHERLVDELRTLCKELVRRDREAKQGQVMIKVDPGNSSATLSRMLAEVNREQEQRLRRSV